MRPDFFVHHFIACRNAPFVAGPDTPPDSRNLQVVSYEYQVPSFPVELAFALFARFILTNGVGGKRKFDVDLYWMDAPGQPLWVANFPLSGPVEFQAGVPVVDVAWRLPACRFPGTGRYEFRLMCQYEPHEEHDPQIPVVVEYILISREP